MIREKLSSLITTGILMGLIIIMIASATFVEKWQGAAVAREIIYHNPLMLLLWLLLVANSIMVCIHRRWLQRRLWGTITLHGAFVIILLGALTTHLFSYEGVAHIREGESSKTIITHDGEIIELPFTIHLIDFSLERYGGSSSPSSFESEVEIYGGGGELRDAVTIGVNRFYDIDGYRLFQSSYDSDEMGTILSVNFDRAGMIITYSGYLLLLLGIGLVIFSRGSHFNLLLGELKGCSARRATMLLLLLATIGGANASPLSAETIPAEHAERVGRMVTQNSSGRIEPIDSYSAKLLRKISRRSSYKKLTAVQVVWGMIFNPDFWSEELLISQKSEEIARRFNLGIGRISYKSLFDNSGNYLLAEAVASAAEMQSAERGTFERDILKLDERVNIIFELQGGELLRLLPQPDEQLGRWRTIADDKSDYKGEDSLFVNKIIPWYIESVLNGSQSNDWQEANEVLRMINTYQQKRGGEHLPTARQIDVELLVNRIDPLFWCMIGYLIAALLLFVVTIRRSLRYSAMALLYGSFLLHTAAIAARWYISGQMPWASSYESMLHIGWAAALSATFILRRSQLGGAIATLFSGVILFVSLLNWLDPTITPLVPVLQSTWLMIHVAAITSAYGLMGISALIGIIGVAIIGYRETNGRIHELRLISELTLHVALYLMVIGIFVGAVWANESWGRYWGWDPKESWALITMFIYGVVLHMRFTKYWGSDCAHFILTVFAFSSVLMTYFGVNFYLTGLHSYASGEMPRTIYVIYIFYAIFAAISLYLTKRKTK